MSESDSILTPDFLDPMVSGFSAEAPEIEIEMVPIFSVTGIVPLRQLADDYIKWSLELLGNDKDATAERLGISRKTIYNRTRN